MNRAERRRAGKTEKAKTYVVTEAQLEKIKNEARAEGFMLSLSIPALVLHDKFGFGEERLNRFIGPCISWMDDIQNGEVTIKEILEVSEKLINGKFTVDDLANRKIL
jgi:hypothetical protein